MLVNHLCCALTQVTVEDVSTKCGMLLRVLHTVAYGLTWYGKWGYTFGRAGYWVSEARWAKCVKAVIATSRQALVEDFKDADPLVVQLLNYYGSPAPACTTLGQLFNRMMNLLKHGKLYEEFVNANGHQEHHDVMHPTQALGSWKAKGGKSLARGCRENSKLKTLGASAGARKQGKSLKHSSVSNNDDEKGTNACGCPPVNSVVTCKSRPRKKQKLCDMGETCKTLRQAPLNSSSPHVHHIEKGLRNNVKGAVPTSTSTENHENMEGQVAKSMRRKQHKLQNQEFKNLGCCENTIRNHGRKVSTQNRGKVKWTSGNGLSKHCCEDLVKHEDELEPFVRHIPKYCTIDSYNQTLQAVMSVLKVHNLERRKTIARGPTFQFVNVTQHSFATSRNEQSRVFHPAMLTFHCRYIGVIIDSCIQHVNLKCRKCMSDRGRVANLYIITNYDKDIRGNTILCVRHCSEAT